MFFFISFANKILLRLECSCQKNIFFSTSSCTFRKHNTFHRAMKVLKCEVTKELIRFPLFKIIGIFFNNFSVKV